MAKEKYPSVNTEFLKNLDFNFFKPENDIIMCNIFNKLNEHFTKTLTKLGIDNKNFIIDNPVHNLDNAVIEFYKALGKNKDIYEYLYNLRRDDCNDIIKLANDLFLTSVGFIKTKTSGGGGGELGPGGPPGPGKGGDGGGELASGGSGEKTPKPPGPQKTPELGGGGGEKTPKTPGPPKTPELGGGGGEKTPKTPELGGGGGGGQGGGGDGPGGGGGGGQGGGGDGPGGTPGLTTVGIADRGVVHVNVNCNDNKKLMKAKLKNKQLKDSLRELYDNYVELLDKSDNCFGKQNEDAQKKATAAMAAKIRRASLSKERQKLKKRNLSPTDCIEELARARARLRNLGKRP